MNMVKDITMVSPLLYSSSFKTQTISSFLYPWQFMNIKNPLILSSLHHSKRPPLLYCDMCGGESKRGLHIEKWEFSRGGRQSSDTSWCRWIPTFQYGVRSDSPPTHVTVKKRGIRFRGISDYQKGWTTVIKFQIKINN